jgi:3-hydroxyisobutyrate dehydrogenase-like beta-hydroxyacid dehydrogenase
MKIAYLGQGAMGARMAARLVAAGHEVRVWNRTPVAGGVATIGRAVQGAEVVITSLRDDAAAEAVWDQAMPGMDRGAMGIETSTISPGTARALHQAAATRGLAFLDAPVAGSRPQAEAGQLIFLAGGEAATLALAEPVLLAMGGAVHHAGDAGAGSAVKLMVNTLFAAQVAVLGELFGMARAMQIDLPRAIQILGATPVASPAAKAAAAGMLSRSFAPAFPIDLVAKDMAVALQTAAVLPVTRAVAGVFREAIAEGLGEENITAVVQRYR